MDRPRSQNLTILLTDIKSFTEKTSQKTRSDILSLLAKHKELVLPALEARGGRLIKTIGDAFLMVFDSPTDAVLAGVGAQESLAEYNNGRALDDRIDVRIAINVGEVSLSDGDIFGEPVNITSRIESIAEAGEVFFTEAVYLAMNKREVPSAEVGLLQLKGLAEKVRVYKVKREHPVEELPPPGAAGLAAASQSAAVPPPRPFAPAKPMARARSGFRRVGALLIDVAVVGILAGIVRGEKPPHGPEVRISARANSPEIKVDDEGVKIGEVRINDKGISGGAVEISDGGIVIKPSAKAEQTDGTKSGPSAGPGMGGVGGNADGVGGDGDVSGDNDGEGENVVQVRTKSGGRSPVFAIVWFLYQTLFLSWWATTPGGRILKLRLVQHEDPARIDWKIAAARTLMTFVSTSVACIGWVWALWEKDGRGWHDLVTGTRVEASS